MTPLSTKLEFVLKALSLSRARFASRMRMDKSAVGRWLTGAVRPSSENLARISTLVAETVPGFSVLDWERDLDELALVLNVQAPARESRAAGPGAGGGLPLRLLEQSLAVTQMRGSAYVGFYRSTRPYAQRPGTFIHDHVLVREDESGLLRMTQLTAGVLVEGWLLLLGDKLFSIGTELTSGAFAFAILNGINTVQAGRLEGLVLTCSLEPGGTPTSVVAVFDRIEDLTGDAAADDARLRELASGDVIATPETAPVAVREHLARDIGPASLEAGGDWILRLPLARSLSRGLVP